MKSKYLELFKKNSVMLHIHYVVLCTFSKIPKVCNGHGWIKLQDIPGDLFVSDLLVEVIGVIQSKTCHSNVVANLG